MDRISRPVDHDNKLHYFPLLFGSHPLRMANTGICYSFGELRFSHVGQLLFVTCARIYWHFFYCFRMSAQLTSAVQGESTSIIGDHRRSFHIDRSKLSPCLRSSDLVLFDFTAFCLFFLLLVEDESFDVRDSRWGTFLLTYKDQCQFSLE